MKTEEIKLSQITENAGNPRTITEEKFKKLVKSLLVFPRMLSLRPIVVDSQMNVLGGNMRLRALKHIVTMDKDTLRFIIANDETSKFTKGEADALIGYWMDWRKSPVVSIINANDLTERQKKEFVIKDNVGFGDWDTNMLANEWDTDALKDWGMEDWQLTGWQSSSDNLDNNPDNLDNPEGSSTNGNNSDANGAVERRFLIPPFSVLNTTQGRWTKRKKYWLSMGIRSDEGRDSEVCFHKSAQSPAVYTARNAIREKTGKDPSWSEIESYCKEHGIYFSNGTSIFDPVLCECAYRWFMPDGGKNILDPFCGGSVRGIVAAKCGYNYFGRDLRKGQIEANEANVNEVCSDDELKPEYSCGDSQFIGDVYEEGKADLIFSCPPYADLEVYSKDEADISNMPYPKFLEVYRKIIAESCKLLHDNRFAVWVISEVRGKDGEYYNFVADTIKAFKDAGLHYYNEMILVNQVVSTAIRVTNSFNNSRKVGRIHQNVLVFFKGDMKSIVGEAVRKLN